MRKFNIEVNANAYYEGIEANSIEETVDIAEGWFLELIPEYFIEEISE